MSAPTTTRPVRTPDDVAALGTVLGVWAHPDDELYLSGGVLAAAVSAGRRVVVVTATRGEHGTDDPGRWSPARLAAERSREITASLSALDPVRRRIEHRFLGDASGRCHRDGALVADPGDEGPVDELAAIVAEVAPDTVVTFGPDGITGHRDHRAVSAWTDRALRRVPATPRLLHAAVTEDWVRRFAEFAEPMDDAGDAFVPCRDAELAVALELDEELLDRKLAALRAQATQTAGLEAAVGADRYRASIAGEYFRPAATLFDGS